MSETYSGSKQRVWTWTPWINQSSYGAHVRNENGKLEVQHEPTEHGCPIPDFQYHPIESCPYFAQVEEESEP